MLRSVGVGDYTRGSLELAGQPGQLNQEAWMEVGGERVEWWGSLCGVGGERVGWWGSLELAGQPDQLNQEAWGLVRDSAFKWRAIEKNSPR